jgi:hypothetical protein
MNIWGINSIQTRVEIKYKVFTRRKLSEVKPFKEKKNVSFIKEMYLPQKKRKEI